MRDDADALRIETDLVAQATRSVLGVGDDRVHGAEDAARLGALAAGRAAAAGRSAQSSAAAIRGQQPASSAGMVSHW